jgi:hypothetical protein
VKIANLIRPLMKVPPELLDLEGCDTEFHGCLLVSR